MMPEYVRKCLRILFPISMRRRIHQWFVRRKAKFLSNEVRLESSDIEYRAYVEDQISKSYAAVWMARGSSDLKDRTVHLVACLKPTLPKNKHPFEVLCVGCRNGVELSYIENQCDARARGLDLFSDDERVIVGDMHAMPFPDNEFDVIYSCHNLEHAYDAEKAVAEYCRVLRPGGIMAIEVPISFETNDIDRWDFESVEGLMALFGSRSYTILFEEQDAENERVAPHLNARVIVRVD